MKELCVKYGIVVRPKSEPTRQMVVGTGNQEKEPPREGSPPTAPESPGAPSLYPNVPPYLGASPPQKPARVCPLVETGGKLRPTQVHKPFSLLELRQIKQDLGSYTDDPGKYIDTFQHITLAFDLTWKDIVVIFSQTLSDHEHAAAAKSLQSCPTLCDPIDGSPPGSPVPGILQARTLEWVAISFSRGSSQPRD